MTMFAITVFLFLICGLSGYVVGWAQCDAKWRSQSKPHRDGVNPEPANYWPDYQPLKTKEGNHQNDGH